MGASSSTCSSSTTTNNGGRYDLFISFRGEDIRDSFRSHLCDALSRKKIDFYVDDKLKRGDEIWSSISTTIEDSEISLVIFSKNYASSKWCLRELVKILECKKTKGQTVIPVFYYVDPSDVRKQTGSFEDAFVNHKNVSQEEKQIWRAALTEASNLSGWHSSVIRPESRFINEIVEDVLKKLNDILPLSDSSNLIGIYSRVEKVKSLLCIEMLDFGVVGIWGMGGIGKTTIATTVFEQISNQFEGCCFLANVREESEKCGGLICLQKEIICRILKEEILNWGTPNIPDFVKRRLQKKKVFIVLDDVTNSKQLETLAGGLNQFGPGSRVIMTTRDKQLLCNCGVNNIYEVEGLMDHESFQLFRKCVFKQDFPPENLMLLANRVIYYAKGNPLALKVLGLSLCGKSKQEQESALDKLHRTFNPEILDVLKISYDGLDDEEQGIFLDIACFFKGDDKDYVAKLLGDCYYSLSVLIGKSLITISDNRIEMHDLLQQMGREIVRKESPNKPGNRSRLWKHEDVLHVLKNDNGTDAVEGICLDTSKMMSCIHLSSQTFEKMNNLKFLKLYDYIHGCFGKLVYNSKVHFPNGLNNYFSDELRSLDWLGYPLNALPSNFTLENLVELRLNNSNLKRLWEGTMYAPKLKWLILYGSPHLTAISDLLDAPLLEKIDLRYCISLLEFPSPVQHLNSLRELNLRGCKNLRSFPSNIRFKSLISLDLDGCINLTWIPGLSDAPLLEEISLQHCISLLAFPSPVQHFNNLRELNMRGCKNLQSFPSTVHFPSLIYLDLSNCINLARISDFLDTPFLEEIKLQYCRSLLDFPSPLQHFNNLYELDMRGCENLCSFPNNIHFPSLTYLNFNGCINLTKISGFLDAPSLEIIDLQYCRSLLAFPSPVQHFNNLRELALRGCKSLRSFPSNIQFASLIFLDLSDCIHVTKFPEISGNIRWLNLSDTAIDEVPSSIQNLTELVDLNVSECKRLTHISTSICKLKFLKELNLGNCSKLGSFPEILEKMTNLEFLYLSGTAIKELPYSVEHLSGLSGLYLSQCENLESLPSSIYNLTSLKHVDLSNCSKLEKLPEKLGNIRSLDGFSAGKIAISQLPSGMMHWNKLQSLYCSGCRGLAFTHLSRFSCSLTELDLKHCNLTEVPEDIGLLSSLVDLDLSGNEFECLPKSMKQLSNLQSLYLDNCNMLRSVVELPSCLHFLSATSCKQLQSIPDASKFSELVINLYRRERHFVNPRFIFTNCLNLSETAIGNILALLINQYIAMIVQGYGSQAVNLKFCYSGSEVPRWFRYQTYGASINIQKPWYNHFNGQLLGFAVCAVIAFEKYSHRSPLFVYYHFKHSHGYESQEEHLVVPYVNEILIDSDQVALGYFNRLPSQVLEGKFTDYSFEFRLSEKSPNCRVKYCGVSPIYVKHNTIPSGFADEKFGATGETSVKEKNKVRKFHYHAETSGKSTKDEMEPHPKRICS